jgi:hypothetical protein
MRIMSAVDVLRGDHVRFTYQAEDWKWLRRTAGPMSGLYVAPTVL